MEVAKLTATGLSGVKTITRNPDIKDIKTAYYLASSPYRGILEKPNLWDGSKDIVELCKEKGIEKIHIMPKNHDTNTPVYWGYNPSITFSERTQQFLAELQENSKKLGMKFEPVTEDIKFSHIFTGDHDRASKAGGINLEG